MSPEETAKLARDLRTAAEAESGLFLEILWRTVPHLANVLAELDEASVRVFLALVGQHHNDSYLEKFALQAQEGIHAARMSGYNDGVRDTAEGAERDAVDRLHAAWESLREQQRKLKGEKQAFRRARARARAKAKPKRKGKKR